MTRKEIKIMSKKYWNVIILNGDEIIRKERKKYT